MTYLELCQKLARESGTVKGEMQPSTVTGATGRLALICGWINDAWAAIQRGRSSWLWMQEEFQANSGVIASLRRYEASNFGLTRWASWHYDTNDVMSGFTIFDPTLGVSDESTLQWIEWQDFRRMFLWGADTEARPSIFAISPKGEIVLAPTPDKTYTLRGEYRKGVQTLVSNSDVPEMPADFHDVIWRAALLYLAAYDENQIQPPLWRVFEVDGMSALTNAQLPRIGHAGIWR